VAIPLSWSIYSTVEIPCNKRIQFSTVKPFILGLLWFIVNALLYNKLGIKIVFDSHRYLAYAEAIETGSSYWYQAESIFYSSYTFVLYLFLYLLHLPVGVVIFVQIVFSGVALIYLYRTVLNITSNNHTAFICLLLYILWPEIHQWNFYIHTESLYISATIFLLYSISEYRKSSFNILMTLLIVLFTFFLRPNGFFLLLGASASVISYLHQRNSFKFSANSIILVAVVIVPLLIYVAKEALEIYSPMQYLVQGQVIQGYDGLHVSIAPVTPDVENSVLKQLWCVVVTQPYAYVKLLLLRFVFFWGQARPYYSAIHNFVIFLYFIPVYGAALYGMKRLSQHPVKPFMLVVAILQTTMSLVIAVDWDNRFIVPLMPFVFIFAAIGFHSLYAKFDAPKL